MLVSEAMWIKRLAIRTGLFRPRLLKITSRLEKVI